MMRVIDYLQDFNYVTMAIRLVLAVIAGGFIGYERGKHGSAAGLRTHILVCIGSAMTSLTGYYVSDSLQFGGDVLRLSAQVVSGIGFLGAGMIIVKNSNTITGLTTAAGMWATASIGIALGYGFYSAAAVATVLCFITIAFLSRIERSRKKSVHIYIEVDVTQDIGNIVDTIRSKIDNDAVIESTDPKSNVPNSLGINVIVTNINSSKQIREEINNIEGVRFSITE